MSGEPGRCEGRFGGGNQCRESVETEKPQQHNGSVRSFIRKALKSPNELSQFVDRENTFHFKSERGIVRHRSNRQLNASTVQRRDVQVIKAEKML